MATSESDVAIAPAVTRAPVVVRKRMSFRRWFRELGWRHAVALLAVLFALFPFLWILSSSVNSIDTLTTVRFIPESLTTNNYTALFDGCALDWGVPPFNCDSLTPVPLWLWNTVKIALLATVIQLVFSALAAYSFARLRWRGRRGSLIGILLVQMFPQFLAFVAIFLLLDGLQDTFGDAIQVALWIVAVPMVIGAGMLLYLIRRKRNDWSATAKRRALYAAGFGVVVGLSALLSPDHGITVFPTIGFNTHTGLVMVYLGGAIGVNTWLIKGFMDAIPTSLDEAVRVDGGTDWDIFAKVILPLSRPILIVIFILTFVGLYNEYILATILITDVNQFTYATGLNLFVESEYAAVWGQLSAAAVIGTFPILLLFLVLQDRIVSGLQGAVKG